MGFGFSWSGGVTYNNSSPVTATKHAVNQLTGSRSLSPKNILKAGDVTRHVRIYNRESSRVLRHNFGLSDSNFFQQIKPSRIASERLRMADYGPVNLPAGGVAPLDALGSVAVTQGGRAAEEKIQTYLTQDEIDAQKVADAQAAADAEAARVAGQELLMRRRRMRDSGLLASGFGSLSSDYKTVLGV